MYRAEGGVWIKKNDVQLLLDDNQFSVYNATDSSKVIKFDASNITTGTIRTATWQDKDGVVAYLSDIGSGTGGETFKIDEFDILPGYHEDKIIDSQSVLWETFDNFGVKTRSPYINPDYNFDFDGDVSFNGSLSFGPAVTVDINANTNNLLIPNLGSSILIRLNFTGNYALTGIVPNDVTKGQWIIVINVGTGQGSLKDNDAASTAQNRFLLGANKTIQTNEGIALVYDTVDTRWRSFAINI
ncbi:MAG: hypothetical protein GTO02_16620 [Candidatus Dadabacteria bacterium]|nr:hypothetical protein [Candidatus Dadabacteria bacterium]